MQRTWTTDAAGFLGALLHHWASKTLLLLGLGSTFATYIGSYFPNFAVPRWVPVVFFAAGLLLGAFDLYRAQRAEANQLHEQLTAIQKAEKKAALVLRIYEYSAFMRHATPDRKITGTYLHFRASVENRGTRASVIHEYQLRIHETGTNKKVTPAHPTMVQGPTTQWAVGMLNDDLAADNYIRVPSGHLEGPKKLRFSITEIPPPDCHSLHGTLMLSDTNGETTLADFELPEHP
jgi:hypothetical protein